MTETAVRIPCKDECLVGILHEGCRDIGVVIIVGGPQYRVGSHRQFVLLARFLAAQGYPVLRFDCRGMGDSSGDFPGFEHIEPDIRCAVDFICLRQPDVRGVVLWGLCDAASAALMYAVGDRRIAGLVLLNPWVRTETGLAQAQLRRYYATRVFHRDFWRKLFKGQMPLSPALSDLIDQIAKSLKGSPGDHRRPIADSDAGDESDFYLDRMGYGLKNFGKPILIILSGADLTAAEFEGMARSTWRHLLQRPGISIHRIAGANHTFASREWRDEVATLTSGWLTGLGMRPPLPETGLTVRNVPGRAHE